jgi:hypothetical protein
MNIVNGHGVFSKGTVKFDHPIVVDPDLGDRRRNAVDRCSDPKPNKHKKGGKYVKPTLLPRDPALEPIRKPFHGRKKS